LSHWSRDVQFGPDDVVVFYFAGHALVEDRDRHYLLCWDSVEDDPTATALATEDVLRILVRSGIGNVLFVLDTCYGGAGLRDAVQVALRGIARRSSDAVTTGMWFVSSAMARDEAVDGALIDALPDALVEVGERTGQRQRYLDLVDIVEALNRRFAARGLGQRAELTAGMVTGLAPFLRNRGYREHLPREDTDLELQRRFARRELHDHFGPRSRGVDFDSEQGLYFHGRTRILNELVQWLTADRSDGKGRIVTGSPGCGKSAVLGRIVAMSDPGYRQWLMQQQAAPGQSVPVGLVDVAVHARQKRLPEVVEQIASGLGLPGEPGQPATTRTAAGHARRIPQRHRVERGRRNADRLHRTSRGQDRRLGSRDRHRPDSNAGPPADRWVNVLAAGKMYGRQVLAAGGNGVIRLWSPSEERTVAEMHIETTPQDLLLTSDGYVCIATVMGVVALHVPDWSSGGTG